MWHGIVTGVKETMLQLQRLAGSTYRVDYATGPEGGDEGKDRADGCGPGEMESRDVSLVEVLRLGD